MYKRQDRLRSEIGRLDVKDIVTDSRGRLTLEVRDALNSGSAGTEDEVSTPAADDAIAKAAERVEAETNGKVQMCIRDSRMDDGHRCPEHQPAADWHH